MFHLLFKFFGVQHSSAELGNFRPANPLFDPMRFEGQAIVDEVLVPGRQWWIYFRGTWWNAISVEPFAFSPKERVYVVGRIGNTLIIAPLNFVPVT
ncbi:NfeD family protein [Cyanobacteria bacterium FACHB-63]|nr:NfeD family protein [Cyanobacteria bacterium FACHB-63]